jgi:hypothetical protein
MHTEKTHTSGIVYNAYRPCGVQKRAHRPPQTRLGERALLLPSSRHSTSWGSHPSCTQQNETASECVVRSDGGGQTQTRSFASSPGTSLGAAGEGVSQRKAQPKGMPLHGVWPAESFSQLQRCPWLMAPAGWWGNSAGGHEVADERHQYLTRVYRVVTCFFVPFSYAPRLLTTQKPDSDPSAQQQPDYRRCCRPPHDPSWPYASSEPTSLRRRHPGLGQWTPAAWPPA